MHFGVFGTTVVAFFLAEMGDMTQVAAVALASRDTDIVQLMPGTTFGMARAHVPAVLLGGKIAPRVSMGFVHGIAAVLFAILGMLTLFNVAHIFCRVRCAQVRPCRNVARPVTGAMPGAPPLAAQRPAAVRQRLIAYVVCRLSM